MPTAAGPELPPHLLAKRKRQQEEAEASKNDASKPTPSGPPESDSPKRRRVIGPAVPPAPLDQKPTSSPAQDSDSASSSDDDYGPSMPTTSERAAAASARRAHSNEDGSDDDFGPAMPSKDGALAGSAATTRDAWMTMPPTADSLARLDPARQRARGFNTSKNADTAKGAGVAASWTETPEEKRKRLADEVLGIAPPSSSVTAGGKPVADHKSKKADEETARRLKEHSDKYRGESLLSQHQKDKGLEEKEDDPSKRGWDWEKDMKAAPKLGRGQKKEMMNRATGFSSRFSGGGFL